MIRNRQLSPAVRLVAPIELWPEQLVTYVRELSSEGLTFDPTEILAILDGQPGRWLKDGVPAVSLIDLICLGSLYEGARELYTAPVRSQRQKIRGLINQIRGSGIPPEHQILAVESLTLALDELPAPVPRSRRSQRSFGPHGLAPLIVHLVEYLDAQLAGATLEHTYRIVARILHLASVERILNRPGAVKAQYIRWINERAYVHPATDPTL